MKIIQNNLVGEEISSRIIELYLRQKKDPYPELIYFTYYNRLVLYFPYKSNRDTAVGSTASSFRLAFNPAVKVLAVHYYESAYSHVDYEALVQLWKYVDGNVVGNCPIKTERKKTQIYLKRNKALMKKKRKEVMMRQSLTHKTVVCPDQH